MSDPFFIEELPAEEIKAVLETDPSMASQQERLAIETFLERVGGMENANLAARLLGEVEDCP